MLGRSSPQETAKPIPQFVDNLHRSLKSAYDSAHQQLSVSHQRAKTWYDRRAWGIAFFVGERVWLYTPAVKPGRTKKLSSLWRGPYTVLDRTWDTNYSTDWFFTLDDCSP